MALFAPVTIATLPVTRGPVDSPATLRILGMFSNWPASGMPSTSCWERASRRRLAVLMVAQSINHEEPVIQRFWRWKRELWGKVILKLSRNIYSISQLSRSQFVRALRMEPRFICVHASFSETR